MSVIAAQTSRLATELWLEIFGHLTTDIAVLKQGHATNRLFHQICRPLLFRKFYFCPFFTSFEFDLVHNFVASEILLPQPQELDLSLKRLLFYTSRDIAPFVRVCNMSARRLDNRKVSECRGRRTGNPYLLLEALFQYFPRFINLRVVTATRLPFDNMCLDTLSRIPNLTSLSIQTCSVQDPSVWQLLDISALSPLHISSFSFRHEYGDSGRAMLHWLPLLCRNRLRYLDMGFEYNVCEQLVASDPFPRVNTLLLEINPNEMTTTFRVLSKFPADRSISELREFTGSVELLRYGFLAIPTLRRLTLPISWESNFLDSLTLSPNIMALDLEVEDLDHRILEALCGYFPNLHELRVQVEPRAWNPTAFFAELSKDSPLSLHLRKISIIWVDVDEAGVKNRDGDPDNECDEEFRALWTALDIIGNVPRP
ncbi:hypothetical protein DFH06DRAFT_1473040 [Mycena polygramma]|nr:hypothetical protein DFH06DRAFT_1473040 [Mycena polygramma]